MASREILDTAFANAQRALDKYLLLKYIFFIRPYSKFSSPNAFNIPMEEGRYDEIKDIGVLTKYYSHSTNEGLDKVLAVTRV